MGQSHSVSALTEEELQDYQDLTYLTKNEIKSLYRRFQDLSPRRASENKNFSVPSIAIMEITELAVNPFKERICKVFSTNEGGSLNFEDFLDMMSVFSEAAPTSVKLEYAFRIYDFDEDGYVGNEDIRNVVQKLASGLTEDNLEIIINQVIEEADLDGDGKLSFAEFETVMSKAPDFAKYGVLFGFIKLINDEKP